MLLLTEAPGRPGVARTGCGRGFAVFGGGGGGTELDDDADADVDAGCDLESFVFEDESCELFLS